MAKKRMKGNRETRKPKQDNVKKMQATSISELGVTSASPAKRK